MYSPNETIFFFLIPSSMHIFLSIDHNCGVNKALLHVLSLSTDHSICIWFLCIVWHPYSMAPIALQLLWRYKSHYYVSYRNTGIYHDFWANFKFFLPKHSALGKQNKHMENIRVVSTCWLLATKGGHRQDECSTIQRYITTMITWENHYNQNIALP